MKKIFMFLSIMVFALVLSSCFADVDSLEWVDLPDSVYIRGSKTLDDIKDDVRIKINNQTYTLGQALGLPDVTVSGFSTDTLGKGIITITYKSLTIYYTYEVVENVPSDEPVVPSTAWYDGEGKASPYTLNSIEDLYGLAKLVNEQIHDFAGEVIKLAVDIDLSDKVWTPIGESARKNPVKITDTTEIETLKTTYATKLASGERIYGKYIFLTNSLFAEVDGDDFKFYGTTDDPVGTFFAGTFDGQGHKITGLSDVGYTPKTALVYANSSTVLKGYTFGLFGVVKGDVTVKNLVFEDVTITGTYYESGDGNLEIAELDSVGAAIGFAAKAPGNVTIDNVKVLSGTISVFAAGGGLVGRTYNLGNLIVKDSENRANVTVRTTHAGGVIGYAYAKGESRYFLNVTNYGNVQTLTTSEDGGAGGITNLSYALGIFENCRNFGNIIGIRDNRGLGIHSGVYNHTLIGCSNYGTIVITPYKKN